jgi:hypothetical protein
VRCSHFVFYERTRKVSATRPTSDAAAGTRRRRFAKPKALFTLTLDTLLPAYRSPLKTTRAYGRAPDATALSCAVQILSEGVPDADSSNSVSAELIHQFASFSATLLLETRR